MPSFYLDRDPQPDGAHLLHITGCHTPQPDHRINLGNLRSWHAATFLGQAYYHQITPCPTCLSQTRTPGNTCQDGD